MSNELMDNIKNSIQDLKGKIRNNVRTSTTKDILADSRIRREKRMKELQKIKDEYAERNTPKDYSENRFNTPLETQPDIDSNMESNELMENIRNSIQELKQQKLDRMNLKGNDESFDNSLNDNSDNASPLTRESEQSLETNEPEDKNISDSLEDVTKDSSNVIKDADIVENVVNTASDVADTLEGAAGTITAAGGEFDPIQDIIGAVLAIGGAVTSGVSINAKKPVVAQPIIEQQEGMAATEA
jgi:hypothetical protein